MVINGWFGGCSDGKAVGDLLVRGPWVTKSYYREGKLNVCPDGWFQTGDVAKIDPDGFLQLTGTCLTTIVFLVTVVLLTSIGNNLLKKLDRSKDVIKSGGEWISSIELENEAVAHPKALETAVIAVPHPKWEERPLLIV
jgi:acyl-CoA synthetase (AMP-forming)/AMP-acid ligase II